MDLKNAFTEMKDELLTTAAGGISQGKSWKELVTGELIPELEALEASAEGDDRVIVRNTCNALRGTMEPGAQTAEAVGFLQMIYREAHKGNMQSALVRNKLGLILAKAQQHLTNQK